MRDFRRLSKLLTQEAAVKAANALGSSWLDYCNSLFRSLSGLNVRKILSAQNSLARIFTNTTRHSHVTPVYWLSVQQWSVFKTTTVVYKFLQSGYPNYFRAFLNPRKSFYNTRGSRMEGEVL